MVGFLHRSVSPVERHVPHNRVVVLAPRRAYCSRIMDLLIEIHAGERGLHIAFAATENVSPYLLRSVTYVNALGAMEGPSGYRSGPRARAALPLCRREANVLSACPPLLDITQWANDAVHSQYLLQCSRHVRSVCSEW